MRFRFIAAEKATHSVTILCRCLHVTRSGFYGWTRRGLSARAQRDLVLRTKLRAFHAASGQVYGRPRLWKDLKEDGEAVSEKRVTRLMREEQIQGKIPKRFKQTTNSQHDDPIAANLLDRDFTAAAPNQRWVGDTTEFVIGDGGAKLYLAAILDLYSRFVVGWAISAVNDRRLTLKALGIQAVNSGGSTGKQWWSDHAAGPLLQSVNPATGEVIAAVRSCAVQDYEHIVARAQEAFATWRMVPAPKRGELVRLIGQALREKKDQLGTLVSLEVGKIKAEGDGEVQEMIDMADFAVGQSRMLYGATMPSRIYECDVGPSNYKVTVVDYRDSRRLHAEREGRTEADYIDIY